MRRDPSSAIATAVAVALAKQTSDTATALAKQTADSAAAVALRATEAASAVAITVSSVAADVKEIKDKISSLSADQKEGFKAVDTRLAYTNGKVTRHEEAFIALNAERKGGGGFDKLLWVIISVLMSFSVGLVTFLLSR